MTRVWLVVLVVAVTLVGLADVGHAEDLAPSDEPSDVEVGAEEAEAADDGCGGALPVVRQVCGGIGGALALAVQPVVAGGVQGVFHGLVTFVVHGAGWLLEQVASVIDTATRPKLTSSWFERAYRDITAVAMVGLLPFLLLAIIQALVRQDVALLLRAVFGYVPLAAIGTAAAVVVVDLLVEVTDLLSAWVGSSIGSDLVGFTADLGQALVSAPAGAGTPVAGLAMLLAAGVIAFASFVIWLELLLRQAAIYVAVLFLPLGFMAMVWPATAHWLRRLVQGLVAIILSKFVIIAVMGLAAAALRETATEGGFPVVIAGASLLSMAALAPYVLLRLIPVFEAGFSGELEGTYRRPTAAVGTPATGHHIVNLLRRRGAGGNTGGAPAGAYAAEGHAAEAATGSAATATRPGGMPVAGSAAAGRAGGSTVAAGDSSSAGAAAGSGATAGVAAAGATVAAGAGGAKKTGSKLRASGDGQYAATSGNPAGPEARPTGRPAVSSPESSGGRRMVPRSRPSGGGDGGDLERGTS